MKRTTLLFAALFIFAAGASAQQYKWVDRNGRVQYGDTPPPGVTATPLRGRGAARPAPPPAAPEDGPEGEAEGEAPAREAAAKSEPAVKKGPLTPAEMEAEFRKRREQAEKDAEKQAKAAQEAKMKQDNCQRARAALAYLESGQRVSRTNAQGERYFLDDAQIAGETERARRLVKDWCS